MLNQVKTLLGVEVKLEQMKLENGTVLEADAFSEGNEIFIVTEDERVALPVGEYVLEDGQVLVIEEEGIIKEMKSDEEEAKEEEEKINDLQEELKAIEEAEAEYMLSQIKAVIKNDKRLKKGKRTEMESFSDYPQSVRNNAKRGIDLNKKVNNKCATQVGKVRAQQLADGRPVSMETIKRMFSYLSRAEEYYKTGDTEACGYISYLLWGGKSAKSWAESKIKANEKK